jgi:hypothetical protein
MHYKLSSDLLGTFAILIENMLYKYLFLLVSAVLLAFTAWSQPKKTEITGTVIDAASGLPVEYANVQLLRNTDSSIIKATASDKKGKFILEDKLSFFICCGGF